MAKQLLSQYQNYAGDYIQGERDYQEDYFDFDNSQPNDFLMTLADGMGGHQGGAVASRCAVEAFIDNYHAISGRVAKRLRRALQQTNRQLALTARSQPNLKGMGCTLVGVAIHNKKLEWISIGDSPLWLYSAGQLRRLNADHSMKPLLQEQVQIGELTPEEAAVHPNRNMLLSALTGGRIDMIDQSFIPIELYPGDRVLLASDGILTLSDAEISKILSRPLSVKLLVNELLDAIKYKSKPTQDNTTALVVEISDKINPTKGQSKFWRWQTNLLVFLLIVSFILWTGVHFQFVDLLKLIAPIFEISASG